MKLSITVKYLAYILLALLLAYILAVCINGVHNKYKNKIILPIYYEYVNIIENELTAKNPEFKGDFKIENHLQEAHVFLVINSITQEIVYILNNTGNSFNTNQFIIENQKNFKNISKFRTFTYNQNKHKFQIFVKKIQVDDKDYEIVIARNINELTNAQNSFFIIQMLIMFVFMMILLRYIETNSSIKKTNVKFDKQIEKEKAFFQSLVKNNSQSLMVIVDTSYNIQDVSESFETFSQYTRNELVKQPITRVIPSFVTLVTSYHENKNMKAEIELISKSMQINTVVLTIVPYYNIDGKVEKYLIVLNDLSDIKNKTEQLVKELNTTRTFSRISQLLSQADDPVLISKIIVEESKKMVDYDYATLFLVNDDELLAYYSSDPDIISSGNEFKMKVGQGLTGLVAKTQKGMIINNANTNPIPSQIPNTVDVDECLLSVPLISKTKFTGVVTFTRLGNIGFENADLKTLELITAHAASLLDSFILIKELALSESNYYTLINQSALAIMIFRERSISYCNKKFSEILELPADQIIEQNITSFISPKDKSLFVSHLTSFLLDNQLDSFTVTLISHNNRKIIMNFTFSNISWENHNSIMITALDITEKKELDQQLLQTQKLESVGVLATGIAHDFKNILAGITGAADMILMREKENEGIQKFAQIIKTSADRGTQLSQMLFGYSRKVDSEKQIFNVNDMLNEIIEIVSYTFEKNIEIIKNLSNDILLFEGDSTKVQQCILNLCVNARDVMQKGGQLSIVSKLAFKSDLDPNRWKELQYEKYIKISIRDTGPGIPKDVIENIFDLFFTTKGKGKGTGLGLSITKRIIDEYNGKIIVESELNKGTTFQILLPAAKSEPAIEDKTIIINETQITNVEPLHIVIVDDEEFVLEIAKELLQELGNTVYTAQSGAEALEIVKSHADIKLALIDRMMPKMDGVELFYKLKELKPDIKVVIASGFKNEEETKLLKNDGLSDYITKPYRIDEISRIISEV